jgi:hypothetical protein
MIHERERGMKGGGQEVGINSFVLPPSIALGVVLFWFSLYSNMMSTTLWQGNDGGLEDIDSIRLSFAERFKRNEDEEYGIATRRGYNGSPLKEIKPDNAAGCGG